MIPIADISPTSLPAAPLPTLPAATQATNFAKLLQQPDADATGAQSQQGIEKAATEFESFFISLLLKEMRSTLDKSGGGLFAGEGSDTYGGMFDMFMGQHLAKSNPLGIGDAIRQDAAKKIGLATEAIETYQRNTSP